MHLEESLQLIVLQDKSFLLSAGGFNSAIIQGQLPKWANVTNARLLSERFQEQWMNLFIFSCNAPLLRNSSHVCL